MPYRRRPVARAERARPFYPFAFLVGVLSFAVGWTFLGCAEAVAKKPVTAKASVVNGTPFANDALDGRVWSNDPCAQLWVDTGQTLTPGSLNWLVHGDCLLRTDYLGSIRHRLGLLNDSLAPLQTVASVIQTVDQASQQTASRLNIANGSLDALVADLSDVKASIADTSEHAQTTASRLQTTNDRLSSLDDRLVALDARLADLVAAVEAQGPNLGSPTFPGASEENATYVRLASDDATADQLVTRSESSVMFAAGLLAALLVGASLWRSVQGGGA